MMRRLASLHRARSGSTAIEFAILAPVFLMTLMGLLELGYQTYISSVLDGAMNDAGRSSTLEDGASQVNNIDQRVKDRILEMAPGATFESSRKAYSNFADVGKPEPFNDLNGDGVRDENECYEDINGNGAFDLDRGKDGQGGADDIVNYTMTVTYPPIVPLGKLIGWSSSNTASATTVLRNQPFGNQAIPNVECKT
ncbi:pilus assembly protein [Sphingomonas sp. C3-2]|uniref:TadE/TadG family type IV pilus assembly protein n=1 Tax=Sphingomonas sp. C3-2 TaxID=3062169 RepID=UPI00294AADC5|nr:pilus assembly protein [Sphingomonas sp. C3-2]WOK36968.1 pilus assembly protein [Sphingomonas sp. C3-2]